MSYANRGLAALVASAGQHPASVTHGTGCCAACDEPSRVAGITDDFKAAKWLYNNKWAIASVALATGGLIFAGLSYEVNKD